MPKLYMIYLLLFLGPLIMGDGSWDKSTTRFIFHFQIFTLSETRIMKEILL